MVVEAHPDGGRRRTTVIVVFRASGERVALNGGGSTLKDRKRERGRKTSSTHTSTTENTRVEEQEPE